MLPADPVHRRTVSGLPAARRALNARTRPSRRAARPAPAAPVGPHPIELAGQLHELTAHLLGAADVQDALVRLAGFTRQALPPTARCAAVLVGDGLPLIHAAAGDGLAVLDDPHAEGPGLTATRTRELVTTPDLGSDPRWPALAAAARAAAPATGVSVVCLPLDVRRQSVGSLAVWVPRRGGLEPGLTLTAMALAGQAEVLLGEVLHRSGQAERTAGLITTLGSGAVVDHAVGVIVAQRGCEVAEAYGFLHETAQRLRLPPAAVAEKIVTAVARR